jgi:hypothetical protein
VPRSVRIRWRRMPCSSKNGTTRSLSKSAAVIGVFSVYNVANATLLYVSLLARSSVPAWRVVRHAHLAERRLRDRHLDARRLDVRGHAVLVHRLPTTDLA